MSEAQRESETAAQGSGPAPPRAASAAACVLVLAFALALAHAPVWRAGAGEVVPVDEFPGRLAEIARADVVYEAWLVGRHARTLRSAPWRLFETEHCAPMPRSLTVGIPMIGLGALGVPAALLTRNPIPVYNAALTLQSVTAALAMFALVTGWTRRPAAGLAAALLFAFHPIRLGHITHPSVWDISFTAFALFFAERLFSQGRWRDAAGLAAAISLQIASDFYPLVAAALIALPFSLWLWLRRAPRRASPAQIALPAVVAAAVALLVFAPYLGARAAGTLRDYDAGFLYAHWKSYAPGEPLFFGWTLLGLALLGAFAPRRTALAGLAGDPRAPLVAGAALALLVAAGPDTAAQLSRLGVALAFDPHAWLAALLPGLSSVRVVERLAAGALLVACALAGSGLAWLLARAGRGAAPAACALVAVALASAFGLPFAGQGRGYRWNLDAIRPGAEQIEFFEELAVLGNTGPLFEVPFDSFRQRSAFLAPPRILLSAWHGRRTSACYGSAMPPERALLEELALRLPERDALRKLREQGFTTLLVHHPIGAQRALPFLRPYERAAAEREPALRFLHRIDSMSAYELLPEPARPTP